METVTVPTAAGEIGILPNHVPLISTLESGILSYTKGGSTDKLVVAGGLVEVGSDKVSILADIAETAADIDVENARLEKSEAENFSDRLSILRKSFRASENSVEPKLVCSWCQANNEQNLLKINRRQD